MSLLIRCLREEFSVSINSYCIYTVLFWMTHILKSSRKLSLKKYKEIPRWNQWQGEGPREGAVRRKFGELNWVRLTWTLKQDWRQAWCSMWDREYIDRFSTAVTLVMRDVKTQARGILYSSACPLSVQRRTERKWWIVDYTKWFKFLKFLEEASDELFNLDKMLNS